MKFREFGRDKIQVSEVGLGVWQLGNDAWGEVKGETGAKILDASLEAGVSFYDTADVYGTGQSESLLGDFLKRAKSKADNLFVTSKVGRSHEIYPKNYTLASITESVEGSLERLGIDCLDLIQLHCVPPQILNDGEIFDWLRTLIKDGKIKRWGASVESDAEALVCLEQDDLYSLQIIFNIMRQKPLSEVIPLAKKKDVAIIARLPLNSGMLSGKFTRSTEFGKKDHRNYNRDGKFFNVGETFGGLPYEKGLDLVEELREILPSDIPMSQSALRWCLDQDGVSVIIPGASKIEQATSNPEVSDLPSFSAEVLAELSDFYQQKVHPHIRGVY